MSFFILGNEVKSPVRFAERLPFPQEDLETFPWLAAGDRYYSLEKQLDAGGFSIPFVGHPCDKDGQRVHGAPSVVIKVPNLAPNDRFQSDDEADRMRYIQEQSLAEWEHVRKRLLNCKHANPIFDLGTLWIHTRQLFVTAQLFLQHALPLNKWLVENRLRPKISVNISNEEIDDWHGISRCQDWKDVAVMIARGLAAIHQCRVVHGDIWPPNVFISQDSQPYAVFIDFAESFVVTPTGNPRTQINHAYRAPERASEESVPTEQVDVYSFGKLLLYLAIGKKELIDRSFYGQARREFVRKLILERNPTLVKENPSVVDIIAHCTALDPVERPRMRDICEELNDLLPGSRTSTPSGVDLKQRLQTLAASAETGFAQLSGVFLHIIDKKIAEVEQLIDDCQTEMIEIVGTRDQLIRTLVALFNELSHGDSWTTLTTPVAWHGSALGLDGRYSTATIQAIRRGASVHRVYVVSIEELGIAWSEKFARKLEKSGSCNDLASRFRQAVAGFRSKSEVRSYKTAHAFLSSHQTRFMRVIDSLRTMIEVWELQRSLFVGNPQDLRNAQGLYVGLVVVPTLFDVRMLRAKNPVSLMRLAEKSGEPEKWLLVMTDLRGRNENEPSAVSKPELRGTRIHKSVQEVPRDRIIAFNRLLANPGDPNGHASVNIGPVISVVANCALDVPPIGSP